MTDVLLALIAGILFIFAVSSETHHGQEPQMEKLILPFAAFVIIAAIIFLAIAYGAVALEQMLHLSV